MEDDPPPIPKRRMRPRRCVPTEGAYVCDSCSEEIVVPIDVSAGSEQSYVEDCPVCCHPNVVHVEIDADDGSARVWSESE